MPQGRVYHFFSDGETIYYLLMITFNHGADNKNTVCKRVCLNFVRLKPEKCEDFDKTGISKIKL